MAIVPLRGFGDVGVIADLPPNDLPLNGVSRAENVLFRDGRVTKASGYRLLETFDEGSPRNFGYWLQPWRYSGAQRLAIFRQDSVAVWDGNTITTSGLRNQDNTADITLTLSTTWQSDVFGGFAVASNNVDAPLFSWNASTSQADGTRFAVIPGWGAADSPGGAVKALRSFKNFLFAIGSASEPYTVYWSDAAPVDSFPQSWDYADPTTLAGFTILQAADGVPIDGQALADQFVIYTQRATYAASFRPGDTTFPFDFRRLWPWGAVNTDCVAQFENRHFVVGDEVIYVHDGVTNTRVASRKVERQIFREIFDLSRVRVVPNVKANEVWIYYPTDSGGSARAAVWNWVANTWTFRSLPNVHCIVPSQLVVGQTTYDSADVATLAYDSTSTRYDDFGSADGRQVLIGSSGEGGPLDIISTVNVDGGLVQLDVGTVNIDVAQSQFYSWFERTGIDLDEVAGGVSRSRFIRSVYPQIRGTGQVYVQIGAAETANSAYLWDTSEPFDLDDSDAYKVDTRLTGRYLGFRIGSWDNDPLPGSWEFSGLDLDVEDGGR